MKKYSRFISIILIFLLSFGTVYAKDFSHADGQVACDASLLAALDIYDYESAADTVSRGDAANVIAALLNLKNIPYDGDRQVFGDIPYGSELCDKLCLLVDGGIISADDYFYPESAVKYSELLKMLLCAMGYRSYADVRGGYPYGYLRVAAETDLTESGVHKGIDDVVTKADFASLVAAALECALMEPVSFGADIEYSFDDDNTLLSRYHGIYVIEGVLRNCGVRSMDSAFGVNDNQIKVDDTVITLSDSPLAADNLLGMRVKAYYKKDGIRKTLSYIMPFDNEVFSVSDSDFDGIVGSRLNYYDENGRKCSEKIAADAEYVYNDAGVYTLSDDMLKNADRVDLINNGSGSGYNVVKVYNYGIAAVSGVDYSDDTVYLKSPVSGGLYSVSADDFADGKLRFVTPENELLDISKIKKNDILSLMTDEKNLVTDAIVSQSTATARVDGVIEDSGGDRIVLDDGREYKYSKNTADMEYFGILKIGAEYDFYFDHMGRIANVLPVDYGDVKYGYLADAAVEGVFDDKAMINIYMPGNGGLRVVKCADKVTIDGTVVSDAAKIVELLQTTTYGAEAVKVVPKPVKYRLNSDGEINMLNTPVKGAAETDENIDFVRYGGFKSGTYNLETHIFGGQVRVDADTKIFCVPLDDADYNRRECYVLNDFNYLRGRLYPSSDENIEFYGMSKDMTAEVIVLHQRNIGGTDIGQRTPATVVSAVSKAINKDGDTVCRIKAWENNKEVTVYASADFDANMTKYYNGADGDIVESVVKVGDIIRYSTNSKGEIVDYDKIFSLRDEDNPKYVLRGNETDFVGMPESHESLLAYSTGIHAENGYRVNRVFNHNGENNYIFGAQFVAMYGAAERRVDNDLIITGTLSNGKIFREFCDTSKMKILTLDEQRNMVYVSSIDEIKTVDDYGEDEASELIFCSLSAKSSNLIIVKRMK